MKIKSLAFSSIIQFIDDVGDDLFKIEEMIDNSKNRFTYFSHHVLKS